MADALGTGTAGSLLGNAAGASDLDGLSKRDDSSELLESQDSQLSVTQYVKQFVSTIEWLLYAFHHDTSISFSLFACLTILEAYQWASYPFFAPTPSAATSSPLPWESTWSEWIILSSWWASSFLSYNLRGFYAACAWVVIIPMLGFCGMTMHHRLRWKWPLTALRWWLVLSSSVMFLPVAGSLLRMMFGCSSGDAVTHHYFSELSCYSGHHSALVAVACLLVIFLAVTCYYFVMCYFEINSNQRVDFGDQATANAKSSGRVSSLAVLIRGGMLGCFILFSQFSYARWPLSLAMVVAGALLLAMELRELPHYDERAEVIVTYSYLWMTWSGICMVVTNITEDNSKGPLYLAFFGAPFLLLLSALFVKTRIGQVLRSSNGQLTSGSLFRLKARLCLRAAIERYRLNDPWGMMTDEQITVRTKLWQEVEALYTMGVERFPQDPLLHVHFACFYFFHTQNFPLAFRCVGQANQTGKTGFDITFLLFLFRTRTSNQNHLDHSADVTSYIEFKHYSGIAENAARTAARTLLDFWSELMRGTPNVERLLKLSLVGRQAMMLSHNSYERVLAINPNSVAALRAFGGFVLDFFGDLSRSSAMLHRADELEEARSSMAQSEATDIKLFSRRPNLDIYDERNSIVSVSVEKQNLGIIVGLNGALRRAVGATLNSELLGHNINTIIPEPVKSVHDDILNAFLYRNASVVLNSTRVVIAVHKLGHVTPFDVNIRWADSTASKLIGVISPIVTDDELILYEKATDQVTYCSINCYPWFNISREGIIGKSVTVSSLFPALSLSRLVNTKDKKRRAIYFEMATRGRGIILAVQNGSNRSLSLMRVFAYTMTVRDKFVSVLRVNKRVDPEHLNGEENILGFTPEDTRGEGAVAGDYDNMLRVLAARREARVRAGLIVPPILALLLGSSEARMGTGRRRRRRRHARRNTSGGVRGDGAGISETGDEDDDVDSDDVDSDDDDGSDATGYDSDDVESADLTGSVTRTDGGDEDEEPSDGSPAPPSRILAVGGVHSEGHADSRPTHGMGNLAASVGSSSSYGNASGYGNSNGAHSSSHANGGGRGNGAVVGPAAAPKEGRAARGRDRDRDGLSRKATRDSLHSSASSSTRSISDSRGSRSRRGGDAREGGDDVDHDISTTESDGGSDGGDAGHRERRARKGGAPEDRLLARQSSSKMLRGGRQLTQQSLSSASASATSPLHGPSAPSPNFAPRRSSIARQGSSLLGRSDASAGITTASAGAANGGVLAALGASDATRVSARTKAQARLEASAAMLGLGLDGKGSKKLVATTGKSAGAALTSVDSPAGPGSPPLFSLNGGPSAGHSQLLTQSQVGQQQSHHGLLGKPGKGPGSDRVAGPNGTLGDGAGSESGSEGSHGSAQTGDSAGTGDSLLSENGEKGNRRVMLFTRSRIEKSGEWLGRTRRFGWLTVLAVVGVGIAILLNTFSAIDRCDRALTTLANACHTRHLVMRMVSLGNVLEMAKMGVYNQAYYNDKSVQLKAYSGFFKEIRSLIMEDVPSHAHDYFFRPQHPWATLGASGEPVVNTVNFDEFTLGILSSATVASSMPKDQANITTNRYLYELVNNGLINSPVLFDRVILYYKDQVDKVYEDATLVTALVLCAAVFVVLVFVVLQLRPYLSRSTEETEEVSLLFLALPKSVVRLLQKRFVTALKNQGDEDEDVTLDTSAAAGDGGRRGGAVDDVDDASDSGQSDDNSSLTESEMTGGDSGPGSVVGPGGAADGGLARNRVSESRSASLRDSLRTLRISGTVRSAFFVLLLVVYVIVMCTQIVAMADRNVKSGLDISASSVRQQALAGMRLNVRRFLYGLDATTANVHVQRYLGLLGTYNTAVIMGDPDLGLTGTKDAESMAIHFDNPCIYDYQSNLIMPSELATFYANCETFKGGLVHHGLQESLLTELLLAYWISMPHYRGALNGYVPLYTNEAVIRPTNTSFAKGALQSFNDANSLSLNLLEPILIRHTNVLAQVGRDRNSYLQRFTLGFWVGALVFFVLTYALIMNPFYDRVHEMVRDANTLLLVLPPDVAMKVPQVGRYIQDSMQSSSTHT